MQYVCTTMGASVNHCCSVLVSNLPRKTAHAATSTRVTQEDKDEKNQESEQQKQAHLPSAITRLQVKKSCRG